MNSKEYAEIRRRLNPEKNNIDVIRGCYVNEKREIVTTFSHSLLTLPQGEAEKYLSIFRKTITGTPGKNLIDIAFRPDQVLDGDQHALLTALKNTALKVDQAVEKFFQRVADALDLEGNYLILLMYDAYDLPFHPTGEEDDGRGSENVFSYILCSVCPVKLSKGGLCYCPEDRDFHDREADNMVGAPELGFMFPAFDDRAANIYGAEYYTRDTSASHDDFIAAVFDANPPMPAAVQKETFQTLLGDALEDDCSLDVVQAVRQQICDRIEEKKADKSIDQPMVSKREMSAVLTDCGVPEARVQAFEQGYDDQFGTGIDLRAVNIVEPKRFEVRTPDVVVKVNPDRSDLVETRVIDGMKYILIRADEGVEVNGVNIAIASEADEPDAPF